MKVLNPVILRFLPPISSYVISPVTFKSPPIVTLPVKFPVAAVTIPVSCALPVFESIVPTFPTLSPPLAVTIPANAALPNVVIVAPVLTERP